MSSIVLGIGASHTTLMNTHWHAVTHLDRAERFRDALGGAREALVAAEPDVVVIFGSNHFRGFYLDLVPAFTIGVGECIASGEAGTPSGPQRVDVPLARHLASALLDESFDIAFSAKLQVDHGISHAIQYLLHGFDVPIVPVILNVFAPPLPRVARCAELGAAIRRAVASFPGGGWRLWRRADFPIACRGPTGARPTVRTKRFSSKRSSTVARIGRSTSAAGARSY